MTQPDTTQENPSHKRRRFYVPQLDGLRFLAFLLVFIHHGPRLSALFPQQSTGRIIFDFLQNYGWCGVDLFLVLSAYLITSLLLIEYQQEHSISLHGFYLRRILRIWPLYYLMTFIGFFLLPWLVIFAFPLHSPGHAQLMKNHFLAYCTLFGNFSSGVHGYATVGTLAHLWTVTLEEQFYIVWPLTLSLLLRIRKGAVWVALPFLLAGTVTFRMHLIGHAPHPYIWTNTLARLDPLLVGIAIACWRHTHPARPGWLIPTIKLMVGMVAVCAISLAPSVETQSKNIGWQYLATAGGFGLILDSTLSFARNPFALLLSQRPLVWLGKLTYGLYVYHVLGLEIGEELANHLSRHQVITNATLLLPFRSLVSLGFTVVIAALSYRYFESFFLRLKERFSRVKSRPVESQSELAPS
jgi:peptidoglycan/LPS O-acetylase OafA/YrhL